jgi:tripartite-type tricarboxylate transporter receptor subunit TctC
MRTIAAVCLALCALCPFFAQAQQAFPAKPVRFIVPFPPGQATDIAARVVADELAKVWRESVVVDNRGGGAGVPALLAGRDAAPDGYTITLGTTGGVSVNPAIFAKLPYDPPKDFVMVHAVFTVPQVVVAHAGTPYRTLQDLVGAAKKTPGQLNWGYPGIGAAQHLSGELFKYRAGIDITPVLYKGSGPAMTDLLGGQVPLLVDSLVSALPHIKSGKIRALAVTTLQRTPHLPEVPTIAEQGYPGFEGVGWGGLMVPKATPPAIVERIAADTRRVMQDPAVQQRIIDRGLIPDTRGTKEWGDFVAAETAKWGDIVRRIDLKMD